jgi:hypothetical protein
MKMNAQISPCKLYRYWLTRSWNDYGQDHAMEVCFVMLNPSRADHAVNDPTLKRCLSFAMAWGFEKLVVRNLYSFRTPQPKELFRASDPIGPDGDMELERAKESHLIVAAWGVDAKEDRVRKALRLLAPYPLYCLGLTKEGAPRHPLYVKGSTHLVRYV